MRLNAGRPIILPAAEKISSLAGITARLLESPPHRALLALRENGPLSNARFNRRRSRRGVPARNGSGDDGGGIDGPRHAHGLRVGCGAVNPATPRDGPRSHASPWPIYNGFDHQPTENELRALNEQDVAPAQAKVIDKLYDQLMSADKGILGNHSILP